MISFAEAMALIESIPVVSDCERVLLQNAVGWILSEDIALPRDQPSFDRATMDGYAVMLPALSAPEAGTVRVVGTVAAGSAWSGTLRPGEAVRIMTGAPCPEGTTVVPHERTKPLTPSPSSAARKSRTGGSEPAPELVWCEASALVPGRNIAWRGEDGRAGAVVAHRGILITPTVLAVAGMCGRDEVLVERPLTLRVLTTGDEVGGGGLGHISDSNGPFLAAFAHHAGCLAQVRHVADAADALRASIEQATAAARIVVTTGGVSGSATDLVPAAAKACGFETVFHGVAMQPGKPVMLARHPGGCFLVGLPGNAVSVVATAHLFLLPLIGRLAGGWRWRWLESRLAHAHTPGKRHQFLPARLSAGGVAVVPWNGSGDLLAAAAADGLVDLPPGAEIAAGAAVRFLPYLGGSAGGAIELPPRKPRTGA